MHEPFPHESYLLCLSLYISYASSPLQLPHGHKNTLSLPARPRSPGPPTNARTWAGSLNGKEKEEFAAALGGDQGVALLAAKRESAAAAAPVPLVALHTPHG